MTLDKQYLSFSFIPTARLETTVARDLMLKSLLSLWLGVALVAQVTKANSACGRLFSSSMNEIFLHGRITKLYCICIVTVCL